MKADRVVQASVLYIKCFKLLNKRYAADVHNFT